MSAQDGIGEMGARDGAGEMGAMESAGGVNLELGFAANLRAVEARVAAAAERAAEAGLAQGGVKIIAVSKTRPAAEVMRAHAAGISRFGENRPQELAEKQSALELEGIRAEWHMIGHLQTNKLKLVVGRAALIQSVDRMELAEAIQAYAARAGVCADILLEVNVAREISKQGFFLEDVDGAAARIADFPNIRVLGLMTVAPFVGDPEQNRWVFAALRKKYLDIDSKKLDNIRMKILSMGMSNDFEVAVEEGSNMVRIGTALFGRRDAGIWAGDGRTNDNAAVDINK